MLMAAARLDLPVIFVTGGPMATGQLETGNWCLAMSKKPWQSVANHISEQEFEQIEQHACPGAGACGFMGTANTMNIAVEVLDSHFQPAPHSLH
jgi:dihydroxy-acid dehydratase